MERIINMQELTIRQANISDISILYDLIIDYLHFYKITVIPAEKKLKAFIKTVCENTTIGYFLLAEFKSEAVGFATLYKIFSTFQAQEALILNDLYILPRYRKLGVGTQLFNKCKKIYQSGEYAYMEWMTAPDNENAISFYLKHNAKKTDWVVFKQ